MQNFLVYYRAVESKQESRPRTCDDVNWALAVLDNTALLKTVREASVSKSIANIPEL